MFKAAGLPRRPVWFCHCWCSEVQETCFSCSVLACCKTAWTFPAACLSACRKLDVCPVVWRCLSSIVDGLFALGVSSSVAEESSVVPLPRSVARELVLLAVVSPLVCSNTAVNYLGTMFAPDASLSKVLLLLLMLVLLRLRNCGLTLRRRAPMRFWIAASKRCSSI